MILLNGSNITKIFDGETLFEGVSFNVENTDKIGFVGINGAGKSTLFKIITGALESDGGEIFRNRDVRIGMLEQHTLAESENTIMEEMLTAFDEVRRIERELEDIRFDIERNSGNTEQLVARQAHLQERFSELDGFFYKSRIKSTLTGLGFSEAEFDLCVSKLSGGQKTRVALAKILLSDANLLLLDEPTNHLDVDAKAELKRALKEYRGSILLICHEPEFYQDIVNEVWDCSRWTTKIL